MVYMFINCNCVFILKIQPSVRTKMSEEELQGLQEVLTNYYHKPNHKEP